MNELKARFPRVSSTQLSLFASEEIPLPNNPYAMGRLLDEKGKVAEAKRLYQRAIETEDHVPESYCNIGVLESQMGRSVEAITAFAHALAIRPLFVEARYNMALEYLSREEYVLAELHIEVAIQLDPKTPDHHFCRALVGIGKDEFNVAMESLGKFRDLAPNERLEEVGELERLVQDRLRSHRSRHPVSKQDTAG